SRGQYPRAYLGEQSYWTIAGADGDREEALIDEDGRGEAGKGGFSLEPFLLTESGLRTWADGRTEQSLAAGFLPIPTATRIVDSLSLSVTALCEPDASPAGPTVAVRYVVKQRSSRARNVTLFVALRPFPVNPPSQSLNAIPGAGRIRALERRNSQLLVNDERLLAN